MEVHPSLTFKSIEGACELIATDEHFASKIRSALGMEPTAENLRQLIEQATQRNKLKEINFDFSGTVNIDGVTIFTKLSKLNIVACYCRGDSLVMVSKTDHSSFAEVMVIDKSSSCA